VADQVEKVRRLLSYLWYKTYHFAMPKELLRDLTEQWSAEAEFDGPERSVFLRVGSTNANEVYIDLCNDDWEVVHVTAYGWKVRRNAPIKFIRASGMLPLPRPVRDENALQNFDNLLTNLDADGRILYKCFLLGCLNPTGKYPVLVVTGEQGSTKSTVCRVIRALIDPSQAPLTTMPSPNDLLISASKSWLQAFDNVSHISQEMSDALCQLATGGGRRTRKLFTNEDEIIFSATRPILINSIVDGVVTAPDLADRSLGIHTRGNLSNYKDETTFWAEFDSMKAGIFGLLCDAVQESLSKLASVDVQLPRMADFARWVIAGETKLGLQPGDYTKAGARTQQTTVFNALDASPIYQPVVDFTKSNFHQHLDEWKDDVWQGDLPKLRSRISVYSPRPGQVGVQGFPRNACELRAQLNRIIPALRTIDNIKISFPSLDSRTRRRLVQIERPTGGEGSQESRRQGFKRTNPAFTNASSEEVDAAIQAADDRRAA
jgi:hypothetical protein